MFDRLRILASRIRGLFSVRRLDRDFEQEIDSHLAMLTDENIRRGMPPDEARRAARLRLGSPAQLRESHHDLRTLPFLESLVADIRFALRMLLKNPGFTTVAVLTLALGIGANTAIFSILDPLLIRKLPVHNPDELVWVNSTGTLGPAELSMAGIFYAYRDKASVFSSVLAYSSIAPYEVTHDGRTTPANGELVSGNYFAGLGVRPFAGRVFSNADVNGPSTIMLSFDFWKREFNSDPGAIGKTLSFGDQSDTNRIVSVKLHSCRVVGVAPPEFFGAEVGQAPDFYVPLGAADFTSQAYWQTEPVTILARLKPGISIPQAQASLDPLLQEAGEASGMIPEIELQEGYAHALLTPAARGLSDARAEFSLPARILMVAVGLLLLIACGNIANLLLARGMARKREFTVRLALGAGRWRVIRQLLTESTLLAAAGAVAGLAVGRWTSHLLVASLSTQQLPIALATGLNGRLLFFTAVVLALTVLVCGLAPALSATRGELAEELKVQGSASHRSSTHSRLGNILIAAQVALSMTLLAGTGLLLHSLFNLETFDTGFSRDKVLAVAMNGYSPSRARDRVAVFYEQLLERVKQLPGVRSASYASFAPISGKEIGINVVVDGYTVKPGEVANERFIGVSPGYFETMGIPLLQGRDFTEEDVHPNSPSDLLTSVAIVNRTMAHRFFGDGDPIGKYFRFVEGGTRPPLEIVGVVADSKYNDLREGPTDFFYIPGTHGDLQIRAIGSAKTLAGPLIGVLHSLDSSVTVTSIKTLREQIDNSLHPDRLIAALCGVFSILALVLTCVGLYGTLAFHVVRRTGEIGIRMALGAQPRDIFRLVVAEGMRLTVSGLVLGIAAALGAASMLASLLFGVKQTDPLTFLGVSVVLLCAAALACYIPARRAMRVDPMVALRHE